MHVDSATTAQVKTASTKATSAAALANASLFSSHLSQAASKRTLLTTDSGTSSSSSASSSSTDAPKGEKTKAVDGHKYAEIIAGPRNGMFVNTSGNSRDGEAFARVRRDGREFHIYGTGKNRLIVEVKSAARSSDSSSTSDTGTSGSTATDTTGTPTA